MASEDELVDVTITGPDAEQLAALTRLLVQQRLAACGNVIPTVRSIYRWQGAIQDDSEALVLLHTRQSLVAAIVEYVDRDHPYDTPQVVALPVVDAHPGYRRWVLDETAEQPTAATP